MFLPDGWSVCLEDSLMSDNRAWALCWQDPATPLSIWRCNDGRDPAYRLCLPGELEVDILPDHQIRVRPCAGLAQITIDHFLADQVYPRLLAHAGALVIHAGAVRIGDGAVMLIGQSGRGKSTLVASFDRAGMPLIGDDAMVIAADGPSSSVRAVYPSLRLFPDSIAAVLPGTATDGPVAHYSNKERIDVAGDRPTAAPPVPMRAMFSIGMAADAVAIRRLSVAQACMTLVENSFALDPSCVADARRRLTDASLLAHNVPMYDITYPRDYTLLPAVRAAICAQVAALETE